MSVMPLVYSETYSFINALGDEYIKKIPPKLYQKIKEERDKNYNPVFDKDKPLKPGDLSKFSLTFICMINMKYWSSMSERARLEQVYKQNNKILKKKPTQPKF